MHCLDEYQTGVHVKLVFKGQLYSTTFANFMKVIRDVCKDKYHGPKLHNLLQTIGREEM